MLLLFDIDGTLLQGAAATHAQALRSALYEVYGIDDAPSAPPLAPKVQAAGRTDIEIARQIALAAGHRGDAFDAGLDRLKRVCVGLYERHGDEDLSSCVVAGMGDLLAELAAQRDVRLSLLTGNLEPIARAKLARARLDHYFPPGQGAFGSDSERRGDLPAIARRRAGEDGAPYPRERTVVIGDTPRDIACARADRLRCLAVATGPYAARQLAAADGVAESAAQLRELLERERERIAALC